MTPLHQSSAGSSTEGPGNGAAIAIRMAAQGATVVAVDKDLHAAVRTQRQIQDGGGLCACQHLGQHLCGPLADPLAGDGLRTPGL